MVTVKQQLKKLAKERTYTRFLNALVEVHGAGRETRQVILASMEILAAAPTKRADELRTSVHKVVSSDPTFESFFDRVVKVYDSDPARSTEFMMERLGMALSFLDGNVPASLVGSRFFSWYDKDKQCQTVIT